jgi:hypothetical protein
MNQSADVASRPERRQVELVLVPLTRNSHSETSWFTSPVLTAAVVIAVDRLRAWRRQRVSHAPAEREPETRAQVGRHHPAAADAAERGLDAVLQPGAGRKGCRSPALSIAESVARFVAVAVPFFYSLNLRRTWSILVLIGMATALAVYYLAWVRFFLRGVRRAFEPHRCRPFPRPFRFHPCFFCCSRRT